MEPEYFLSFNGQTIGPMTKEQVFAYPVTSTTLVCTTSNHNWLPLFNFPELMEMLNHRQQVPPAYDGNYTVLTDKNKVAAGVLAILLGGLGVQYFYLGKIAAGFITILLSLVTCGLWQVLMLVQGIMMLTMTDRQFEEKYVLSPATYPLF